MSFFEGEAIPRQHPVRPLGILSDFVVEMLPTLTLSALSDARLSEDFLRRSEAVTDLFRAESLSFESKQTLEIACLDLMLFQSTHDRLKLEVPKKIREFSSALCRDLGREDTFLYEDCVLLNPLNEDPRVFTSGSIGCAEWAFLWLHSKIESHLGEVLLALENLCEGTKKISGQEFSRISEAIAKDLDSIERSFLSLRPMSPDVFAKFRPFYLPCPRTGRPGPSGRYSARFYLLRVLTEGDALDWILPTLREEVRMSYPYFPRGDREKLLSWSEGSFPKRACFREVASQFPGGAELLSQLRQSLDRFTAVHYGLVHRNLVSSQKSTER